MREMKGPECKLANLSKQTHTHTHICNRRTGDKIELAWRRVRHVEKDEASEMRERDAVQSAEEAAANANTR